MKNYLSIDVGGTAIKYSLMTEEADILEKGEVPTPMEGLDAFLDVIESIYNIYHGRVEAMVMSAPGRIDADKGYFYTSGALRYIDKTDFKSLIEQRISVPFSVENDAKAAALAELWLGSMKGVKTGTVITLGTGIGGAVIVDGKLHRGYTFAAGEYSNLLTDWYEPTKPHSTWSHIGSVGSLAVNYAREIGAEPTKMNGRIFFEAVNNGDETAKEILHTYCHRIAGGIFCLQVVLDMEKVAIGGGISKQPVLIETLNEEMDHIFEKWGDGPVSRPEIVRCSFGNDANMIGALYHYLHELKG